MCATVACGVRPDNGEHSEEPSNLLRPDGAQHLLCHPGGTHLFPDPLITGGGYSEQVQNTEPAAITAQSSVLCQKLMFNGFKRRRNPS